MNKKPPARKHVTHSLTLTPLELLHLRDLFSVKLPPELKMTVSQMLAAAEERPLIETALWNKVAQACKSAKVPLDDAAPDFAVIPNGPPSCGVYRIAAEPQDDSPQEEDTGEVTVFDRADDPRDKRACGNCGTMHTTKAQKKRCFASTEEA